MILRLCLKLEAFLLNKPVSNPVWTIVWYPTHACDISNLDAPTATAWWES